MKSHINFSTSFLYRRARYCHGKSSVSLSVRLSVCPWRWGIPWSQWLEIFKN